MTWIGEITEATEEIETPKSFVQWAAYSALSAVTKKNVWLDKHAYKLYPNVFVMLMARSGGRKGFAISLARELVKRVGNVRTISGRNSIQAILKELSTVETKPGIPPSPDANAFIMSQEFITLMVDDPASTPILTDLYDTHANTEWKNSLKSSGTEILKNVCITLLGASNPDYFREAVPDSAYRGGFVGRMILIMEDQRRVKNSLMKAPKKLLDFDHLAKHLVEVSKLYGPMEFTGGADQIYDEWYNAFEPEKLDDKTGTAERVHDQVLKIAMLFALSKRLDRLIYPEDIQEAIDLSVQLIRNAKRLIAGAGKSQMAPQTAIVLQELLAAKDLKVDRMRLLQKHWGDFDASELDRVIETFINAGAVTLTKEGGRTYINLNPKIAEQYRTLKKKLGEAK